MRPAGIGGSGGDILRLASMRVTAGAGIVTDDRQSRAHPDPPYGEVRETLRCLIVDDSLEFLDAARRLLQQEGITVAGVASDGDEAVRLALEIRPDVTLIDIDLGVDDGFALARRLAALASQSAGNMILISTHGEDEFADLIGGSPAVGFIAKSKLSGDAIRALMDARPERATGGPG